MSRKSRTTLTFTVTLPLPQKGAAKGAEEFLRNAIQREQQVLFAGFPLVKDPFAYLPLREVIIRQTGRETVYL